MNEKISIEEDIKFSTIESICQIFGRKKYPIRRSFFPMKHDGKLPKQYMLWCPKRAQNINTPFDPKSEWINVLDNPSHDLIYERNIHPNKNNITPKDQMSKLRICFMKQKMPNNQTAYIFRGIYKFLSLNYDGARIYEKFSNEIVIDPFINYYNK